MQRAITTTQKTSHHKSTINPPKKATSATSTPAHGINIACPPVNGGRPVDVFCGNIPEPLIVGVVLVGALPLVVAAAVGDELGAAPEVLVDTGPEEVVDAAAAPALDAQEQMALAASRTEAAEAWQEESTQPWAADWIAEYCEEEHWQA